jgi:hypothetical protein
MPNLDDMRIFTSAEDKEALAPFMTEVVAKLRILIGAARDSRISLQRGRLGDSDIVIVSRIGIASEFGLADAPPDAPVAAPFAILLVGPIQDAFNVTSDVDVSHSVGKVSSEGLPTVFPGKKGFA